MIDFNRAFWVLLAAAGASAAGGFFMWRAEASWFGAGCLAFAAACFLLDALKATFFVAGVAATAALALGLSQWLGPWPGLAWGMFAGVAAMWLNAVARLARLRKRLDLNTGE